MPKRRVHANQLDLERHADAAERQRLADRLEEEIKRKGRQLSLCQKRQRNLEHASAPFRAPLSWWNNRRKGLLGLQDEERQLRNELARLRGQRAKLGLGQNSTFRTPAVTGYGMGDALREIRQP